MFNTSRSSGRCEFEILTVFLAFLELSAKTLMRVGMEIERVEIKYNQTMEREGQMLIDRRLISIVRSNV